MSSNIFKTKENVRGGQFPAYSKPRVIGYYSVDCDRKYCGDLSQLKYIDVPADYNVKFDLDRGRTLAQKKDDSCDEKIDNLLRWMLQNSSGGDWYVLKPSVSIFSKGVFDMMNLLTFCLFIQNYQ
jgi:hypothetical protein